MFKIVDNPIFKRTVTVLVPSEDSHREETLVAFFRALDAEKIKKFDFSTADGATAFLREAVHKLEDIGDAEGKPLPYSEELRDRVIAMPYVRAALSASYFAAVGKAKEGN